MSSGGEERCISPWFGFAVILLVCVIVTSAVFFEFKTPRHKRVPRTAKTVNAAKVRMQSYPGGADQGAGNSIVF